MADLAAGSTFAGHRIDGRAGRGGMGVVYRATDLRLERTAALKLVSPELAQDESFASRFVRESRLAASIDHPNVIPIYHAGEEDGRLYVTMRFVEGTDLAEVLRRDRRLAPERAVQVTAQVAAALDAAHARGLVHRDVKPANILLEDEHVFLTDFGLSKQVDSGDDLTETGAVLGTVDYMAPEQVQGGVVDARSDVYALGCVLFQMLSGRVPFERANGVAKLFAHVSEPAPRVKDVPDALADVVARAMEKDPGRRYESAGELASAAAEAIGAVVRAPTSRPASAIRRPGARSRRRAVWIAAAALLGGIAVAVAAIAATGGKARSQDRPAVVALLRHLHDGFDVGFCKRDLTQHLLNTYFAPRSGKEALNSCLQNSSPRRSHSRKPLVIYDLRLNAEGARATLDQEGQRTTVYLIKQHGRWKVDDLLLTPKLRYERAVSTVISPEHTEPGNFDAFFAGKLSLPQVHDEPAYGVQLLTTAITQMAHIQPPAGLADVHAEVLAAFRAMLHATRAARAGQLGHDATAFTKADKLLARGVKQLGLALADVENAQVGDAP